MRYSSVSCNVQESLNKIINAAIPEFVPMDWMGVVIITQKLKLVIDGEKVYNKFDRSRLIGYLENQKEYIFNLNDCQILHWIENSSTSLIVCPLRFQDYFKVFFVCLSKSYRYKQTDSFLIKNYCEMIYENIWLYDGIVQERNYLSSVLDSTESVIIGLNLTGTIESANLKANIVFGENLVGKDVNTLTGDSENNKIKKAISFVIDSHENHSIKEMVITDRNGEKIILSLVFSPLFDSKNQLVGVVIVATDITQRKILETQMEQLSQFAVLGEIASGVAHDIKNPLMAIQGCAKLVQDEIEGKGITIEFLEPIKDEVERINLVVEQLLSYNNLTKRNSYTMVDINEVLRKSLGIIQLHKGSKYILTEERLSKEIPLIHGSNVGLQQAFINILLNSLQAIDKEGIIRIESKFQEDQNRILVTISDNGIGISPKDLSKIFMPFFTTKKDGNGIGLQIVQKVINEHKGRIEVHSTLNQGTRFEIYFPCPSKCDE